MSSSKRIIPLLINGKKIVSNDSLHIPVYSTARHPTRSEREAVHFAQGATVEQAVEAAVTSAVAFSKWRRVSPLQRRELLLETANILRKRREDGIEIQMLECAPDRSFAAKMYDDAILHVTEWAGLVTSIRGTIPVSETNDVLPIVFREPIGPVLGIAPWNAAPILSMRSLGMPIAAGCTSVFKTSELSPASHFSIVQAFVDAGLPDGVLNVLHVRPQDAPKIVRALIERPEIRKVNFTGSTQTGREIAITAAENLKPVLLELGGKSASIVLEDADLENAAKHTIVGAWLNQGQICMSTERVLVSKSIFSKFLEQLKYAAMQLHPHFGQFPQVTPDYADKIHEMISEALEHGARLVYGSHERPNDAQLSPTILADVSRQSKIYADETFGPTIIVIPIESDAEAINIVNESNYGLSASIWTKNFVKGIRLARDIESGAVHINGMTVHDQSTLPHGGVKDSGNGRFGAEWGLNEFTITKTVTVSGFAEP
ncbi:aldehyde dehydrogenase domain-containing protein [Lipomyces tetrasporus]|uniref:Aldehyde dehydrogenase domain-containing protein n=1 Tax=Lipomyces tetrasporus TaxID=54092 RepID=A0AAD7QVT6_9ASCO|nr:aldehyde dehydrogenase domain-containing protein [Lipomyces tetrasporus]KAJ8102440.1 aldehyde dehydrogenase domain-containing protein [Lipomyces tetrasporus]